jgi:hypothetical protein
LYLLGKIKDSKIKPTFKEGNLIKIDFSLGNVTVKLRDSGLMLPLPLRILGQAFGVSAKDLFPLFFANYVSLFYNGEVPAYKVFKNITKSEYKKYCNDFKNKE